jgi:hypothetical protein
MDSLFASSPSVVSTQIGTQKPSISFNSLKCLFQRRHRLRNPASRSLLLCCLRYLLFNHAVIANNAALVSNSMVARSFDIHRAFEVTSHLEYGI